MITELLGYVGPGPGLTMVWAFFALLGTIALALLSVLLWPVKMLIRKIRGTSSDPQEDEAMLSMDDADATLPASDSQGAVKPPGE